MAKLEPGGQRSWNHALRILECLGWKRFHGWAAISDRNSCVEIVLIPHGLLMEVNNSQHSSTVFTSNLARLWVITVLTGRVRPDSFEFDVCIPSLFVMMHVNMPCMPQADPRVEKQVGCGIRLWGGGPWTTQHKTSVPRRAIYSIVFPWVIGFGLSLANGHFLAFLCPVNVMSLKNEAFF